MHNPVNRHTPFNPVNAARHQLTNWMLAQAHNLANEQGITYQAVASGHPDTYEEVVREYKLAKSGQQPFRVWSGASDKTVYTQPEGNHAFRFIHDCLHAIYENDFSSEGETRTALKHLELASGLPPLARKLLELDTLGQLQFYQVTGQFVENQLEFALKHLAVKQQEGQEAL